MSMYLLTVFHTLHYIEHGHTHISNVFSVLNDALTLIRRGSHDNSHTQVRFAPLCVWHLLM